MPFLVKRHTVNPKIVISSKTPTQFVAVFSQQFAEFRLTYKDIAIRIN